MAAMLSPSFLPIFEGLYWFPVVILASGLLLVSVIVLITLILSHKKMSKKQDIRNDHKDK